MSAITAPQDTHTVIHGKSMTDLAQMLKFGDITSHQLCSYYVDRHTNLTPTLSAVIAVSPHWQHDAQACDEARQQGKAGSSALYGIPVGIKDNINAEGMATTAGSLALSDNYRPDAPLVSRLKAAGALILFKLNMTEWANFRSSEAFTAWSAVGGQTRNPWALDRTPSSYGSSGGSAAAVAAGVVPVAVGAETEGSLTLPGSLCGVVSFKPTVGVVPRTGMAYVSPMQDTAGPMGTTVTDVALMLQVMAGADNGDPVSSSMPSTSNRDYVKSLKVDSLNGIRLGVIRNVGRVRSSVLSLFDAALKVLTEAGAVCVDVQLPDPSPDDPKEKHSEVWGFAEMKQLMNAYLSATDTAKVKTQSLEQLITFNQTCAAERIDLFGQDRLEKAHAAGDIDGTAEYAASLQACRVSQHLCPIDLVMQKHKLQALVAPTCDPAELIDAVGIEHYLTNCCTPPAVAGYPHLTVPMGQAHGLPSGLSIMAGKWQDADVLSYGYAYEQLTKHCKVVDELRPTAAGTPRL